VTRYDKAYKTVRKYFENHPDYNSVVHLLAGAGIGILLTYPLIGPHPIRWSIVFLTLAILGHLYPLTTK